MSTASFASVANADIIEVELIPLTGDAQRVRLLIDSGFTGTSSLVLPNELAEFIRADSPEAESSGTLTRLLLAQIPPDRSALTAKGFWRYHQRETTNVPRKN